MSRFVQGGEERVSNIVLAHARRNPHVSSRNFRAEWMMGLIEPPTFEVVAHLQCDRPAKLELRRLGKRLTQTPIVGRRLITDHAHQRNELAPQVCEKVLDTCRGQTLIGSIIGSAM